MAKYRLIAPIFMTVDGSSVPFQFRAGAEVTYSGVPGLSMVPLDDDARRAKARTIPTTWGNLNGPQHHQIAVARSLGVEPRDAAHALEMIEAFKAEHTSPPQEN